MTGQDTLNRATAGLGLASIAGLVFVIEALGDFRFMRVSGAAIAVALVLGLLACVAGWLARPVLAVVAGVAFLAAALLQLISTATGNDWLGASLSTMSFWLGLGVGLLLVGLTAHFTDTMIERE
ncbi:Rv1678 family membrane protein [Phytoactinopolyspora mesophila]|uniref:Uncharacterized protein n=1 Tax=Phytoactinopolyspora mesophila TaxID=2650750 RepID=A0A7K3M4B6_9ACTN|nr:hypothetical protein [Phytoactinopolyspora mesophila]NDL58161.1 hypothetical protein [Phytoactinopolyspora mesophila]